MYSTMFFTQAMIAMQASEQQAIQDSYHQIIQKIALDIFNNFANFKTTITYSLHLYDHQKPGALGTKRSSTLYEVLKHETKPISILESIKLTTSKGNETEFSLKTIILNNILSEFAKNEKNELNRILPQIKKSISEQINDILSATIKTHAESNKIKHPTKGFFGTKADSPLPLKIGRIVTDENLELEYLVNNLDLHSPRPGKKRG